jgi:hypothetical protein
MGVKATPRKCFANAIPQINNIIQKKYKVFNQSEEENSSINSLKMKNQLTAWNS